MIKFGKTASSAVLAFSLLLTGACTPLRSDHTAAAAQNGIRTVSFSPKAGSGFPEGIAWHPGKQAFLVSSLRGGTVGLVDLAGNYRVFSDDARLITTSGIVADAPRRRILVANEDVGVSAKSTEQGKNRTAQVFELDWDSGAVRRIYDFSSLSQGATLSNDLTVDAAGNIYVTDSFQPQIYRADGKSGQVSVLVRDLRLKPSGGEATGLLPNLNGIVYHPDGFLLASDYVQGKLWRIPLDNPSALVEVRLDKRLAGPDGLVLQNRTTLAAVQTSAAADKTMHSDITVLVSDDGWHSAKIRTVRPLPGINGATTGTMAGGTLWVVNSRYPELFGNPNADGVTPFALIGVGIR